MASYHSWSMRLILFVGIALFSMLMLSIDGSAKTITVDDDGGADFEKIQDAINNSTSKDVVFVRNGTYNESVTIRTSITLLGESRENTIIDPNGKGHGIQILGNITTVSRFTIGNATSAFFRGGYGIFINSHSNTIKNLTISGNSIFGITLINSDNNLISNCTIHENDNGGIRLYQSHGNLIRNCTVAQNTKGKFSLSYGIDISGSDNNTFRSIISRGHGNGFFGVNSKNVSVIDSIFRKNYHDGMKLTSCNSRIINCDVQENEFNGITFDGGNNSIENCNVSRNGKYPSHSGIRLYGCIGNEVSHCTINNNSGNGIYLVRGKDNRIHNSTIINNDKFGISGTLDSNTNHQIEDNFFHSNYRGEINLIYDYKSDEERNNDNQFCFLLFALTILFLSLIMVVNIPQSNIYRK